MSELYKRLEMSHTLDRKKQKHERMLRIQAGAFSDRVFAAIGKRGDYEAVWSRAASKDVPFEDMIHDARAVAELATGIPSDAYVIVPTSGDPVELYGVQHQLSQRQASLGNEFVLREQILERYDGSEATIAYYVL